MICADHFEPDAYLYNDSKRLKADAVPTIFAHTSNPRKPPTKRTLECDDEKPAKTMKIDARPVPASPSKDELRELLIKKDVCIAEKNKKIKMLQQQVRRKTNSICDLRSAVSALKENNLMEPILFRDKVNKVDVI